MAWASRASRPGERAGLESAFRARKGVPVGIRRTVAELFLDPQELVVLRDAVGARGGARLDLAGAERDGEVGDRRVLGLARAVGHDRAVAVRVREPYRLDRLR